MANGKPAVRAVGGSSKYGSLKINEWLQPRDKNPCGKLLAGYFSRAEFLRVKMRPM
jgi:hypothetical protein